MVGRMDGSILANILNLDSTTFSPTWTDNAQTGEFYWDGLPTIRETGLDRSRHNLLEDG